MGDLTILSSLVTGVTVQFFSFTEAIMLGGTGSIHQVAGQASQLTEIILDFNVN